MWAILLASLVIGGICYGFGTALFVTLILGFGMGIGWECRA